MAAQVTPYVESKSKTAPPKLKLCVKCGKKLPLKDFYSNKDWVDQESKDCWCRECVNACSTKEETRAYFWENNRKWDERIWDAATRKAEKQASQNSVYQKTSEERRARILERLTCQTMPSVMGPYYVYEPHAQSYAEARQDGLIVDEPEDTDNIKIYSKEFNGFFKRNELEYLIDYYEGLEKDFDLNDTNLRDTAKKLAKASLLVDKVQDDYMAGKCDFSIVKDAISQYDLLSKSGNFAACKRKPGENGGLSSFSELTFKLETSGHPCTRKIEWPKDDVDKTLDDFRYIVTSLGLDD